MKTKWRDHRGGAAVEFALVLPLLVMLALGIIEFSLLLYDKAMITNASREGARAGILFTGEGQPRLSPQQITAIVNDYCLNKLVTFGGGGGLPTVDVLFEGQNTGDPLTIRAGDPLTIRVSYTYTFLVLPKFVTDLTGGIALMAETVMRYE